MKNIRYLFFVILMPIWAYAQQSPTITCLDVDENGDVTIHWLPPAEPAELKAYDIFYNNGTGFIMVGNAIPGELSFTHLGAQADNQSQKYRVDAVYQNASVPSEIMQTIFLQVGISADLNEATLYWNPPANPLPDGSNDMYYIYMEDVFGVLNLIDSATSEPFKQQVHVCNKRVNFRIELSNEGGCITRSNIRGEQFIDVTSPDKPVFDSVSINYIDGEPRIVMGWEASVSEDVIGYILYRWQPNWIEIDTVYGINSTFYVDTLVPACDTIHKYAISAIDSCGNKSIGTFANPLQNIRLIDIVYNPCMLEATITFEPFIDYEADSITFELKGNSSAGLYQAKIDRTLNAQNYDRIENDIITAVDSNLRVGRIYDYYIREKVYKGNTYYTTSSCMQSIYTYGYEKPTYSYFVNANVMPDNQIELTIDYDTVVTHSYLQLWRSEPGDEVLNYLMTIPVDTLTNNPFTVMDTSANGLLGYYFYGVKTMDSCNRKVLESNRLKTMALSAVIKDRDHNWLRWNRFEGWKAGVEKYYIYRKDSSLEPVSPIDSVYWYENEYIDDISNLNNDAENLVYWVQAVERPGNNFGFKEKSNSNRAVVIPESDIYFPNAFKPETEEVFKPIFRFLGGSNYFFQIYNRWGQLIFETTDPYEGWDGTYNGSPVMQGTYIYKFQYLDVYGNSFNQRGTVTVIY
ncbi:MAG: gliding motility-associated C-terminal domain-containing protein [Bacteroidetes bacterium]|nr:gliding motility-associated C-terminal domain-containing protein [Bacteroidota bacterium]